MSVDRFSRTICWTGFLLFFCGISAVQENHIWIEGEWIDGPERREALMRGRPQPSCHF
jgi:hypothetical protein